MWEEGESCRIHEGPTDSFASEIRVLLVDHDEECLLSTARMLELCSYKVTVIKLASTALLMLQKGKERFDLVIADVHSADMINGFQLLDEAIKMDLLVILTSSEEDVGMARRAIERGASLFIPKPFSMEIVTYLWQIVLREKKRMLRENGNNEIVREEISSEQVYRPQLHLEPHYHNGATGEHGSPIESVHGAD